jgi:hypothetical protein
MLHHTSATTTLEVYATSSVMVLDVVADAMDRLGEPNQGPRPMIAMTSTTPKALDGLDETHDRDRLPRSIGLTSFLRRHAA